MFTGFNIRVKDEQPFSDYYDYGINIFNDHKRTINDNLMNYINVDGSLSESLIEGDWFPKIDAHVFLSHSHSDIDFVVSFAGWLYKMFHIKAFIDSSVWGNADDLLKAIDEKYCVLKQNEDGSTDTYSYTLRNKSTSNVHMILYTALMKMIDSTECLMFINTPASLKWSDMISNKSATASPWIYGEMLASKLIRIRPKENHRKTTQKPSLRHHAKIYESVKMPNFEYSFDSGHLCNITDADLQYFESNFSGNNPYVALDEFYDYKEIGLS